MVEGNERGKKVRPRNPSRKTRLARLGLLSKSRLDCEAKGVQKIDQSGKIFAARKKIARKKPEERKKREMLFKGF